MNTAAPQPSKAVMRLVERAVRDFDLLCPGDRVAVGMSGGKDSLLLLQVMRTLARRADLGIEVEAVHLDQGQPGFDHAGFRAALDALGATCHVVSKATWPVVAEQLGPDDIPCSLCSRMRRGILLQWCQDNGFQRLALGHHLDDAIETFFLNLLFQRRLEAMKPLTPSDDTGVAVIRPLILVDEARIRDWIAGCGLAPIACPVCDSFPRSSRRDVGALLESMAVAHPTLRDSVRHALYGS